MKTTASLLTKILFIGSALVMTSLYCTQKTESGDVAMNYEGAAATAPCLCESSWFPHTQTPAPAEGAGSPFDTSSTTNCIFHQWSWQKFLWLTKPQSNGDPLFMNELIPVSPHMAVVQPQLGLNLVLSSIEQAGGGGILKTTPAYAPDGKGRTVYYSIHTDSTMFTSAEAFKVALNNGSLSPNNKETFPVNSLELKVAWVDVQSMSSTEAGKYYTRDAAIQQSDGSYLKTTVALLGMHVVGVVINHPEFIWATFEHHDMAPDYDWKTADVTSSDNDLVYAQGATTGLAGIQWDKSTTAPVLADKAYTLFKFGVPRMPTDTFMTTSQSEPLNYNNVNSIDSCVATRLSDIWNNYYYKGSIWLNTDGLSPAQQADTLVALGSQIANVQTGAMARGCVSNANLTMETFEQTFSSTISGISVTNIANCFSCHNAQSFATGNPKSPLYISHVFDGYLSAGQGKSIREIDALKLKQYLETRRLFGGD